MQSAILINNIMTNDITTLNGALMELGELMASNLSSKGVEANAEDGLTTLANKILDVTPFVSGLDISTTLSITTPYITNHIYSTVVFTTQLQCFFDDLSEEDVDLSGYLEGAIIKFYNGNTYLGQSITDSSGIATFDYIPEILGNNTIHAVFEGTDNYSSSTSRDFIITVVNEVLLTGDKSIIQSGENVTFTVTTPDIENGGIIADQIVDVSYDIDDTGWDIDFDSTMDIMEIGDTTTLTALVTDENDDPVQNVFIRFYSN